MTDEDIFEISDQYGWMDDFGRWNFQPDRLVSFALTMSEKNVRVSDKWVGLTDDEVFNIYKQFDSLQYKSFAKAIEAKLKEKNA